MEQTAIIISPKPFQDGRRAKYFGGAAAARALSSLHHSVWGRCRRARSPTIYPWRQPEPLLLLLTNLFAILRRKRLLLTILCAIIRRKQPPSEINPAVMALLKSRLTFKEQAQSQVQQVAPTTSSRRAHAASVNSCICETVTDIF